MMNHHKQLTAIKALANALQLLNEKVVFVGGATVSLYPDKPVAEVRPTNDIDVLIEILNYHARIELETRLRSIGFENDVASGINCRYTFQGITVDVLPTKDTSAGFNNIWYPDGFQHAVQYKIDNTCSINILTPPYFIATKLEAFKGRGNNDGRTSKDFEDIVCILENRQQIWEEMNSADLPVRTYIRKEFLMLVKQPFFYEWLDCHVEKATPPATDFILERIKAFVQNEFI